MDGGANRIGSQRMALAALAVWALGLVLFWPGLVEPDTLAIYEHAKTGLFDDWHPPILGRLWQVFLALGIEGTGPLFVLQTGLFWLGLGLIARALDRIGHPRSAMAILLAGCIPHVFGWMTMVIKDAQMTACLIAASGLFANHALARRPLPRTAVIAITMLLAYATLVRHNAVFAAAPLAGAFAWSAGRGWRQARAAGAVMAVVLLFAASGMINGRLFHASHAFAENSLKLFDLAGTAHYAKLPTIEGVSPADWRRAEARSCYTSALWDTYNTPVEEGGCPWIYDAVWSKPLTAAWLRTIIEHFPYYAKHRLAHFNQSLRFWSSRYNWDAASAAQSDNPNPYRIGQGDPAIYRRLMKLQMRFDYTPLGRPFAWYLLGAALFPVALRQPGSPRRDLALALLLSAGIGGASFLVIGVAAEFRYHHWSILAIACAACLVYAADFPHRRTIAAALAAGITALFAIVFVGHMIRHDEWEPIEASSWVDEPTPASPAP